MERVFINRNNLATITCPVCKKAKTIDVSKYLQTSRAVKINGKCPCGNSFSVLVERRKRARHTTKVCGYAFQATSAKKKQHAIDILDISQSGLKFKPSSGPEHDFKIGDYLTLEFNLDDKNRSFVRKEVVVRNIKGLVVGTEFASKEHYDALGAYLLFGKP